MIIYYINSDLEISIIHLSEDQYMELDGFNHRGLWVPSYMWHTSKTAAENQLKFLKAECGQ